MGTSSIGGLSSSYLQQILAAAIQNTGASTAAGNAPSITGSDSSQLSPLAQIASTLQQLQQSDPTKFKQVTEQVSTALQTAAKTATSQGDSSAASQLTQLATDFSNAAQSGQLPNLQDLAQAVGGGGHHHHHHGGGDSDSSSTQTSQTSQTATLNPTAIIQNVLSNAGLNANTSS
jgi:hypothetical protein